MDDIDWFVIVLEGRIRIVQIFSDGSSSLMENLEPAYMLGADLVCTKSRRSPYHAIAYTQVRIFIFPGNMLMEPGVLSEGERILVYLTMQAEQKKAGSFYIPFSRDEMAKFLCVNRSALSHELSKMAAEGLIRFHKNHFTLLKPGRDQSIWDSE